MKKLVQKIWKKTVDFFKWLWLQIKDWRTFVLFVAVCAVISCEVWIPYIIAMITGDNWWWAVGSACWAFWLGPFTPFIPLCLTITLGIKKIIEKGQKKWKNTNSQK